MNSRKGIVGAAATAAAASVTAGVAAERYAIGRMRGRFGAEKLPGAQWPRGSQVTVTAPDGVPLRAEIDGTASPRGTGAPLTAVFCHGYALQRACWHYQRGELGELGRAVFYDQRCHGSSGRGDADRCTIDALGDDLRAVLDATAPIGPVVLVGHSMGGMTIMSLAERHPEFFGSRVAGVALINTSAGGLAEMVPGVRGAALRAVAPPLLDGLSRMVRPVERLRAMNRVASHLWTHRLAFGDAKVSPELVAFVDRMISATPVDVVADFYPAIVAHDKLAALENFRRIPTLVLVGTRDRVVPPEASLALAGAVPEAEFVEVPGAGHMVMLERSADVNEALRAHLDRVREALATGSTA